MKVVIKFVEGDNINDDSLYAGTNYADELFPLEKVIIQKRNEIMRQQ